MLLPDIRQPGRDRERETVSCILRMSECHWLLHSHLSTLLFVWPFVFSGNREPGGDEVTERKSEGAKGVALFSESEALWHR